MGSLSNKSHIPLSNNCQNVVVEKGVPNQTNYISECYPTIPLSGNSVTNYQRQMHEVLNRRKKSVNMNNESALTPSKRHHSRRHQRSHRHQEHKHHHKHGNNIRVNLGDKYERDQAQDPQNQGRNHHHHHRKHHSHVKHHGHHRHSK